MHDLRLHCDTDGYVWYTFDKYVPVLSGFKLEQYLTTIKPDNLHVKIIACEANYNLIVQLYDALYGSSKLSVCTPLVKAAFTDAKTCLLCSETADYISTNLGGWHEVTELDISSYRIATGHVIKHPIEQELSFINTINIPALRKLIALIIDPRWYIDLSKPNRQSKLESFLGLYPNIQSKALKDPNLNKHTKRYSLVLETWQKYKPDIQDIDLPGNFLWKLNNPLKASQKFIALLRNIWLNKVFQLDQKSRQFIFIPKYYFNTTEALAYEKHLQSLQ